MKRKSSMKVLLTAVILLASTALFAQEKGSLTVNIQGLRNNDGRVLIALTESAGFTGGKALASNMAQADTTGTTFIFKDLPLTKVYVQVFHDENRNFQMDLSPEGMPVEGFGSLPASDSKARPSIEIEEGENKIDIQMLYL